MALIHNLASEGDNQGLENELKNVDIDLAAEKTGETALHRAALAGHFNTVKLLVERGANIYLLSKYGNNALHYAAQGISTAKDDLEKKGSYYQIFELLLSTEVKLRQQKTSRLPEKWLKDTVNNLKLTPVTRLRGHPEIQNILLTYISKIEQSFIDSAKLEPPEQNIAQLKQRRIIRPLDDEPSTNSTKRFSNALTLTIFGVINALTSGLNKNVDPQVQESSQPLLDKKDDDNVRNINSSRPKRNS